MSPNDNGCGGGGRRSRWFMRRSCVSAQIVMGSTGETTLSTIRLMSVGRLGTFDSRQILCHVCANWTKFPLTVENGRADLWHQAGPKDVRCSHGQLEGARNFVEVLVDIFGESNGYEVF